MFANHRTLHIICPCDQRALFCPAVNCRYQESMQVLNSLATSNRYQVHCGKFWVPCDTRETSTFAERLKKFQNIQTSLFLSTFLYLESEFRHCSLSTIHLLDIYVHRGHGYTHQKGIIPFYDKHATCLFRWADAFTTVTYSLSPVERSLFIFIFYLLHGFMF